MLTAPLDALTRRSISGLITGYQTYLSPHKGFSCAYRIWHGDESCSQHVKRVVMEQGFRAALPLVRSRFNECKVANQSLRQRRLWTLSLSSALPFADQPESEELPEDDPQQRPQRRYPNSNAWRGQQCSPNCDTLSCDALRCLSNCGPTDFHAADCGAMDCGAMDCGAMDFSCMDCSAIDCSVIDCGSCSW